MPAPLTSPVAADASLHLLADHLADALADHQLEPCLVHVGVADGEHFDLGVLPLAGAHPTDVLLGMVAPDHWHAVGLATHGWAYHVAERARPDRRRQRVHVVTLLSRSGEHAHRTRSDDPAVGRALAGEQPAGEQVDLLRRVLRLPTDPPPCPTSVYWSIQWLGSLIHPDEEPVTTVEAALRAHPAMRLLERAPTPTDTEVDDVIAAFHRVVTWPRLRRLTADGRVPGPELLAADAAWFDDGAFARFLLNRCPPLQLLRAQLPRHVPDPVACAVLDVLDRLGVPETSWPDTAGGAPSAS